MRTFNETVFDDFVYGTTSVYSPAQFAEVLGKSDQLSIQAVVERASLRTTLTVAIEHSQDGINWAAKNTSPEIDAQALGSGTTTLGGADAGTYPSNGLIRLRVSLGSAASPSAYVRVYVTGRDKAKKYLTCACPEDTSKGKGGGKILSVLEEAARIERARETAGALAAAGPRIAEHLYLGGGSAPPASASELASFMRAKLDQIGLSLDQAVSPVDHSSARARAAVAWMAMAQALAAKKRPSKK